jgi:hypothetical protein
MAGGGGPSMDALDRLAHLINIHVETERRER